MKHPRLKQKERQSIISRILAPENEQEVAICSIPEFIKGAFWGKPRYGHPEGEVIYHIREVFNNIDNIPQLDKEYRRKLRLITLTHDIFKFLEYEKRKIDGRLDKNHHAVLAANFFTDYINDEDVLKIIRWHDEAYYCWKHRRFEQTEAYERKLDQLLAITKNCRQLYYLFFKCDTQTGDKTQEPVNWFEEYIPGIQIVHF